MTGLGVDVERMSALEVQRDFLLRSLEDLEREHDAGDVDDADYEALKDDYTARAAAVLRALEAGRRPVPAPDDGPRRGRGRALLVAGATVAFAVLAGVLVAQTAGRRDPGDVITGDVAQSATEKLNQAGRLGAQGDHEAAIALYDEVLEEDPDNAEAATYRGWMLTLSGDREAGLEALLAAATEHRDYPDVHAFLAIVFFRSGLVEQAAREIELLDALDPPAGLRELIGPLSAQIEAAMDEATSTTVP
ncbi:MAG: tetratricopeptide repeat protein [Acidimicrobiia bacterium]